MLWRLTVCTGLGTVSVLEAWISNTACDAFFHELSKLQPDLEAMGFVFRVPCFLFPTFDCSSPSCSSFLKKGDAVFHGRRAW